MSWITIYPLDVVKSRIQCTPETQIKEFKILNILKEIYRKEGFQALFRGVSICSIRAYPVNAVTFLVYEKMKEILTK